MERNTHEFETEDAPGQADDFERMEDHVIETDAGDDAPDERQALLARLREALLASEPALDRSMVTGDSLDELEASFAAATATLAQLREAVRQEQAASVPAGWTGRGAPQPKSAFAKIREGLG